MSATKELSFISVIIISTDWNKGEKRQSKGLEPVSQASYISVMFLLSPGDEPSIFPQIFPHDTDTIPVWLKHTLEGMCRSSEVRLYSYWDLQ